jgi:hypothetical protein
MLSLYAALLLGHLPAANTIPEWAKTEIVQGKSRQIITSGYACYETLAREKGVWWMQGTAEYAARVPGTEMRLDDISSHAAAYCRNQQRRLPNDQWIGDRKEGPRGPFQKKADQRWLDTNKGPDVRWLEKQLGQGYHVMVSYAGGPRSRYNKNVETAVILVHLDQKTAKLWDPAFPAYEVVPRQYFLDHWVVSDGLDFWYYACVVRGPAK